MRHPERTIASAFAVLALLLAQSAAAVLPGDLDGDGDLDAADENVLRGFYGAVVGDPDWEPAADLNGDGRIDFIDLGMFGGDFGSSGGPVDQTAPSLVASLNDVPDDQNDLLVAPPDAFWITLDLDSGGGSAIDTSSLSVTSSEAIGAYPAGAELASRFSVTPTRAFWAVPAGSDLARTSHFLTVQVSDLAGNVAKQVYGFAVRDFAFGGPPLGNLNTIYLDFDQDRSLGPETDFIEDLREFGLSTASAPALEARMRDRLVAEIVARAHGYYGRDGDGSPGPDAANVVFQGALPSGPHARLCVGGESQLGPSFLGAAALDPNNGNETSDECGVGTVFGVFPQAIDDLWGADPAYLATFSPLDPGLGGTPVGADPLDPLVLDAGFDPLTATTAELTRWNEIEAGVAAFAETVAAAAAHETGHTLGLVAHGPPPGGLLGGAGGGTTDHNVASTGGTPSANYLMNGGDSFSFSEIAGVGVPLAEFRPLNWAYLRDRLVLDDRVTGLFPAPTLTSVTPNPVAFEGGFQPVTVTLQGTGFLETPEVELFLEGDPTPNPLLNEVLVDPQTVTGDVNPFFVPPGLYDVQLTNADGQVVVLEDGLEVQP